MDARPTTEEAARDAVAAALADRTPLEIVGGGSKRALGRHVSVDGRLDLSGLGGIILYEPEELVLTARAGTRLAEIAAALAERDQSLAFEPPDWGPLLGGEAGAQTLGGVLACNLAGPRRIRAGAARDHFLGARAVTGRGEVVATGGRVVKNVTGYDLCKLLAGSFGTLAALTEVTVKVLPVAEKMRTVLVFDLDEAVGIEAMTRALRSPNDVSAAAHLPRGVASRSGVGYVRDAGAAVTAVRVEGPAPSVTARCEAVRDLLAPMGAVEELHGHNSAVFWREVGDATAFVGPDTVALWRLSVPPAAGAKVHAAIARETGAEAMFDWGGGLIWLAVDTADAAHAAVRAAIAPYGGHATLVRASRAARAEVPVFEPQPSPLAALTRRIKEGFDPMGILNPGRMYAGV